MSTAPCAPPLRYITQLRGDHQRRTRAQIEHAWGRPCVVEVHPVSRTMRIAFAAVLTDDATGRQVRGSESPTMSCALAALLSHREIDPACAPSTYAAH